MKIIPSRTMRLGGKRVEAGKPADVSAQDGDLAVRHGWATEVKDKPAKDAGKGDGKTGD